MPMLVLMQYHANHAHRCHADSNASFRKYIGGIDDSETFNARKKGEDEDEDDDNDYRPTKNVLVQAWRTWRDSELKRKTYLVLSHPEYSKWASVVNIIVTAVIIISTITFCLESVPSIERSEMNDHLT